MKKSYKIDLTGVAMSALGLLGAGLFAYFGDLETAKNIAMLSLGGAVLPSVVREHHQPDPEQ